MLSIRLQNYFLGLLRQWRQRSELPSFSVLFFLASLLFLGTLYVHSATSGDEARFPGPFARLHLFRMAFGSSFFGLFLVIHYRRLRDFALPLYLLGLGMLFYLLGLKFMTGGVVRWVRFLGIMNLQPSELMKVFAVLYLAILLEPTRRRRTLSEDGYAVAVVMVPTLLIALQPDLGTSLVLVPGLVAMLWASGIPKRRLLAFFSIGSLLVPVAWFALHEYQRMRLLVFLNPYNEAVREQSYQLRQSLISIGSGGVNGAGLFAGEHNALGYLPADHNDFIFAVIGEEWGLWGTLTLLLLYTLLYLSCYGIAYRTREPFGRLVVVGLTTQLAFQTFVNLAMTVGMAPVTGLPLPLMSLGGSSLLSSLAAVGLILGIGMRPVRILVPDGLRAGTSLR